MKTLALLLLVAIIFAVIVAGAFLGVLGCVNEETRKRCGNCATWDSDLRICWWDCHKCGEYDKGCEMHVKQKEPQGHKANNSK